MAIRSLSCFPNLLTPAYQSDDRDPLHANILRLIYNSRLEHATCALARGRYGLRDYGQLGTLLPKVPLPRLGEYLDAIDAVRGSHRRCRPCSLKFLAFCQLYTEGRLPERHSTYRREYLEMYQHTDGLRDYIGEALSAIANARRQPQPAVTNVRWFREFELDSCPG